MKEKVIDLAKKGKLPVSLLYLESMARYRKKLKVGKSLNYKNVQYFVGKYYKPI